MTASLPPSSRSGRVRRLGTASRLLTTLGILSYAVAVPLLEANASHLLNPSWPPHARTHEAWQLITNSGLGAFAAWRLWRHQDIRTATLLNVLVMGSFLLARGLQDFYGGSMVVEGRGDRSVLGLDLGLAGFGLALLCNGAALLLGAKPDRSFPPDTNRVHDRGN